MDKFAEQIESLQKEASALEQKISKLVSDYGYNDFVGEGGEGECLTEAVQLCRDVGTALIEARIAKEQAGS